MAAIFCDLDGTLFRWGTENPLPGAFESLIRFQESGGQIIFTTQRKEFDPDFDMVGLRRILEYFPGHQILYEITSPRILINDQGAIAISHRKNSPWSYDLRAMVQ